MVNSVCLAFAHGCIRAEMEISVLAAYFAANNVKVFDTPAGADLILVSACGFDKCAEQTSIKLIKKIIGRKDQASQLAITGCLPAINRDRIRAEFGDGVLLLPAKSIGLLDGIIGAEVPFAKVLEAGDLSHGFIETDVRLKPEQVKQISGAYEGSTTRARKVFDRLERFTQGSH